MLRKFIEALNINNLNLHLTFNVDDTRIPFLDLMIIKNPDGTMGTNLH